MIWCKTPERVSQSRENFFNLFNLFQTLDWTWRSFEDLGKRGIHKSGPNSRKFIASGLTFSWLEGGVATRLWYTGRELASSYRSTKNWNTDWDWQKLKTSPPIFLDINFVNWKQLLPGPLFCFSFKVCCTIPISKFSDFRVWYISLTNLSFSLDVFNFSPCIKTTLNLGP